MRPAPKSVLIVLVVAAAALTAAPDRAEADSPFRGTVVSYSNLVSMRTLQADEELTYNPYYAMSLSMRPHYWFTDSLFVHARLALTHELTDADTTTRKGETRLTDLTLRVGASEFYTIPVVGISLSADLDIITPTSEISQARTLQVGIAPGVGVRRTWDVLGGISVGYGFRLTSLVHSHQTAQRELPLIESCEDTLGGCAQHLDTGTRNARLRLTHSFDLSLGFTKWFALVTSVALATDYLHDVSTDDSVSFVPTEPTSERFWVSTDLGVRFKPMPSLRVGFGARSTHPQLAPDSTRYLPFFNRYTVFYLDLGLDIDGLVTQIAGRKGDLDD